MINSDLERTVQKYLKNSYSSGGFSSSVGKTAGIILSGGDMGATDIDGRPGLGRSQEVNGGGLHGNSSSGDIQNPSDKKKKKRARVPLNNRLSSGQQS
jgi:hypothetical protein